MTYSKPRARVPQALIIIALVALITGCAGMAPRPSFEKWSQWESFQGGDVWERLQDGDPRNAGGEEPLYDILVRVFGVDTDLLDRVVAGEGISGFDEFPSNRGDIVRAIGVTPAQTESLLRALWRTGDAGLTMSPRLAVLEGQTCSFWLGYVREGGTDHATIGETCEFEVNGMETGVRLGFGYGIGDNEHPEIIHRVELTLERDEVLLVLLPTPDDPADQFLTPASCVLVSVCPFKGE